MAQKTISVRIELGEEDIKLALMRALDLPSAAEKGSLTGDFSLLTLTYEQEHEVTLP